MGSPAMSVGTGTPGAVAFRQLGHEGSGDGDVVGHRVGPGVARAQQQRQRLPGTLGTAVHERDQPMVPTPTLIRRGSLFFVIALRGEPRRVQIHVQRRFRAGGVGR